LSDKVPFNHTSTEQQNQWLYNYTLQQLSSKHTPRTTTINLFSKGLSAAIIAVTTARVLVTRRHYWIQQENDKERSADLSNQQ
jgi:hypothetical protein